MPVTLVRDGNLMAFPSIEGFLNRLEASKLLTDEQLATASSVAANFPANSATERLAKHLVRDKTLTHWQAQVLISKGGNFFLGDHKLLELIGRGGMGTVYKAEHTVLDRIVAVKVMSKELMSNQALVARFHKEIEAGAALDNKHVVRSIDANIVGHTHFLVMEYVEGDTLWAVLHRRKDLPVGEACEYIRQAAIGLQHAHEMGMVHRDIKPSNLIRTWRGNGKPLVKIFDLGLARIVSEQVNNTDEMTRTGQIMGTPEYMSPEQGWDTKKVDIRGDIYSLGCTLFRLLTGRVPFLGENPLQTLMMRCSQDAPLVRKFKPEVPAELEAVVAKMLAREPSKRFQTPGEVATALIPFADPPLRSEVEHLEKSEQSTSDPELSDADLSEEELGFEDFLQDLNEPEDTQAGNKTMATVPVAVPVAKVAEPANAGFKGLSGIEREAEFASRSKRSSTKQSSGQDGGVSKKNKKDNKTISIVAGAAVVLLVGLIWAFAGGSSEKHPKGDSQAKTVKTGEFGDTVKHESAPELTINEHDELSLRIEPKTAASSASGYQFVLSPLAPLGMSIDSTTGQISWTPQEADGPGQYSFDVTCTDVADPNRKTVVSVYLQVNEVDLPPRMTPIENQTVKAGNRLAISVKVTDPDIPVQQTQLSLGPPVPNGAKIDPTTGDFVWLVASDERIGEHTITVLMDQPYETTTQLATATFKVNVEPPADTPAKPMSFLADIDDQTVKPGNELLIPIEFTRTFPNRSVNFQTRSTVVINAPVVRLPSGKPAIRWKVAPDQQAGDYGFELTAIVGDPPITDTQRFKITVIAPASTKPPEVADKRTPIPTEEEQAAAAAAIRKVMSRDFAQARSKLTAKATLARELLKKGDVEADAKTGYVFFDLARTYGTAGRDYRTALAAIERLARIYQVDFVKQVLACHDPFKPPSASWADKDAIEETGLKAAQLAIQADEYSDATAALKWPIAISRMSQDRELQAQLNNAKNQIELIQRELTASPGQAPTTASQLSKQELLGILDRLVYSRIFPDIDSVNFLQHSDPRTGVSKDFPDRGRSLWTIKDGNIHLSSESQERTTGVLRRDPTPDRFTLKANIAPETSVGKLLLGVQPNMTFRGIEVSLLSHEFLAIRQAGTTKRMPPQSKPARSSQWDTVEIHVDGNQLEIHMNGQLMIETKVAEPGGAPIPLSGGIGLDVFLGGAAAQKVLAITDIRIRAW